MTASSSYLKPHTLLLTLAGTSSLSDLRQERDFYIHSLYSPSLESIYGKLFFPLDVEHTVYNYGRFQQLNLSSVHPMAPVLLTKNGPLGTLICCEEVL